MASCLISDVGTAPRSKLIASDGERISVIDLVDDDGVPRANTDSTIAQYQLLLTVNVAEQSDRPAELSGSLQSLHGHG